MTDIKILLILPIPSDSYSNVRGGLTAPPHLGIAYLAGYLLQNKLTVDIFDGNVIPYYKKLEEQIKKIRPTHIGFTAYTFNIKSAAASAALAKRINKDITTVIGGPHATAIPAKTLREFSAFDYAVISEGEDTFLKIIKSHNDSREISKIEGIAYRDKNNIIVNDRKNYLDINNLPFPAWELFDLKKYRFFSLDYNKILSGAENFFILTSRGCPFECSFCSHSLGYKIRTRSVNSVIDETEYLIKKYNPIRIDFLADNFTLDKIFIEQLCSIIIKKGINRQLNWGFQTRIDTIDSEIINMVSKAGCNHISMGLESGSQEILNYIKKGYMLEEALKTIKMIKKSGIRIMSNFMIGLPRETKKTINETINFALKSNVDFASFSIYTPFPGTPLLADIEKNPNYKIISTDWNQYRTQGGTYLLQHENLSKKDLLRSHRKAYLRFYFRRGYLLKLFKIVNIKTIAWYIKFLLGYL